MDEARAREGLVHLQAAALELIAACRAFLDVAEQVARDPSAVANMANTAAAAVRSVQDVARQGATAGEDRPGSDGPSGDREDEPAGVTRIRLS